MKAKKLLTAALAGLMAFGILTTETSAATRAELASISVSKKGNFQYWEKNSPAKAALVDYVKDVTNKNSKNFIPVEDRIAVFDVDGTLMCETAPFYFDWMMPIYRVTKDPTYRATPAERTAVAEWRAAIDAGTVNQEMDDQKSAMFPKMFQGMTPVEYRNYVNNYIRTNYVEGLTNLKVGEAFYMPMVEVVSYLNANKFTCYIVSGCERETIRTLIDGIINIEPNHVIGSDHSWQFKDQNGARMETYFLQPQDQLQRGGNLRDVNINGNKVFAIEREIGKQPVIAFGNSTGDASMFTYTITRNKYRSAAFMLLCDDTERERGNIAKAEKCRALTQQYGWIPVSMRNDWTTIYGPKVVREN